MYKFLSRPKPTTSALLPLSGAVLILFTVMSVVAPAQIQHSDARIFSAGLTIKLERNTPPFAALEDNFIEHIDAQPADAVAQSEELGSSTLATDEMISRIVKGEDASDHRIVLKSVSREEVLQTLFMPLMQSMDPPDSINGPATVAIGGSNASGGNRLIVFPSAMAAAAETSTNRATHSSSTSISLPAQPATPTPLNSQTASTEALVQVMSRQISGTIELTEGLALTSPSDQIVVYHEIEDAPSGAEGTVWIRDGRYKIQVDDLSGRLVAELRGAHGELLGRGQLDLVDLPLQKSLQFRVGDVALKISPVAQGLSGQVLSGNAFAGQTVVIAHAQVSTNAQTDIVVADAKGAFQNEAITNGSTALVKASRAGYWETVATAATDRLNTLVLLPKAL